MLRQLKQMHEKDESSRLTFEEFLDLHLKHQQQEIKDKFFHSFLPKRKKNDSEDFRTIWILILIFIF